MSKPQRKHAGRPDCTCGMNKGPGRQEPLDHPLHCAFRRGISEPTGSPTGGAEPRAEPPATLARLVQAHAEAHETAKRARQLAGDDGNAFRVNAHLEQCAGELEAIADEALRIACEAAGHVATGRLIAGEVVCVCGEVSRS